MTRDEFVFSVLAQVVQGQAQAMTRLKALTEARESLNRAMILFRAAQLASGGEAARELEAAISLTERAREAAREA